MSDIVERLRAENAELRACGEQALAVVEMWWACARGQSDVTDAQLVSATNSVVDSIRAVLARSAP